MKFKIQGDMLSQSLQSISGIIKNNNAFPVLDNFLLKIEEELLTITSSDLETTAILKLPIETIDFNNTTSIAINAKKLLDIARKLEEQELVFNINANDNNVEITSNFGSYKIATISGEEYPRHREVENPKTTIIASKILFNAISKTLIATGNDDLRPQMMGVLYEQTTDKITFVATDAHKLVKYTTTSVTSTDNVSLIIPKRPLGLLKGIFGSYKENIEVSIQSNQANIMFKFANYEIICRLIEGKYPNYDMAIPKDNPNKVIIDRANLINALKRVSLFANQSLQQVRCRFSVDKLELSAEDVDFFNKANEELECKFSGIDIEIGFNAKYLLEMLLNVNTEEIRIEMSQPNRACLIYPEIASDVVSSQTMLMLVMPVLLIN